MKLIYFAKSCLAVIFATISAIQHANPAMDSVKTDLFTAEDVISPSWLTVSFLTIRCERRFAPLGLVLTMRGERAQGRFVWFLSWWGSNAYSNRLLLILVILFDRTLPQTLEVMINLYAFVDEDLPSWIFWSQQSWRRWVPFHCHNTTHQRWCMVVADYNALHTD